MGSCRLPAPRVIGQYVKTVLSFLTSITLIYISRCLYLFLTEGHHADWCAVLLHMLQCASLVAPASALLMQVVSFGHVVLIGTSFTMLGLILPSLIEKNHNQEIMFAVFYGSGTSIMFQATVTSMSAIVRTNIVMSVMILGLSAAIMVFAHQLWDYAEVMLPRQLLLGLLFLCLVLTCLVPALVDVLMTRKGHTNDETDVDHAMEVTIYKPFSHLEADNSEVPGAIENSRYDLFLTKYKTMWKVTSLLWWAIGIHICSMLACDNTSSGIGIVVLLVCSLSYISFMIKLHLAEKMEPRRSHAILDVSVGYFILGLLGAGGLVLKLHPNGADVHCYVLLFIVSYFNQLKPVTDKIHEHFNVTFIVNQYCLELIFTLFAMIIGYLPPYVMYYKIISPAVSNIIVGLTSVITSKCFITQVEQDISLSIIAAIMVLESLRYKFKGEETSTLSTKSANLMDNVSTI